ncbi:RB1-inducible coiled-coil protein 1-like [Octopus sinensis]|uniref:RB1-inducible coiled-coil protein 1-like n=1 Tax=Octopus sinensis TaxID=2607531 RepID=A0A7E6FQ13_9MOLL|nr:RB1-inducible coiled-coil protein 1-like [Octopus sinensis]
MQKLRAHARRVNEEKTEAKKLYELDITSFKAQILALQDQIRRVNIRKQENEQRCKEEMNNLRTTIVTLQAHVNLLTFEKQKAEETMSEINAINTRREAKKLQSRVREIAKKKQEIEKLHVMQMKVFKTNINRLKIVYDRLYRRFVSKMETLDNSMGANERQSQQEVQNILDTLGECEHQLSISQEHKDTLEEEMLRFDAEYKDLRENEMILADSTKNLQHIIDEKEKQIKEKELEINTRQIRDETHLDLVSKYTDDVENLRSEIAELKEAFQAKQLTLDTLQSEMRQYKEDELNSKDDDELMEFLESEHEMLYDELQDRIKYATDLPLLKKQYEELHAKRDAMANIITDKTEKLVDHKDELEKLTEVAEKEFLRSLKIACRNAKRDAMANIITDKTEKLVDHKDELEKLTEVAEKEILEEFEDSLQKRSRKYIKTIESLRNKVLEEKHKRSEIEEEYQCKIRELNIMTIALQEELHKLHRKHLF